MDYAEIVLRIEMAGFSGIVEPEHRIGFGFCAAFAFGEEQGEVIHRVDVTRFGSLLDEAARFDQVFVDALAALVQLAQFVLRGRDAFLRGAAEEGGGGLEIAFRHPHLGILVLRDCVAGIGFGFDSDDWRDRREAAIAAHRALRGHVDAVRFRREHCGEFRRL